MGDVHPPLHSTALFSDYFPTGDWGAIAHVGGSDEGASTGLIAPSFRWNEIPPAGPQTLEAGDELIITGPIGRHGIAVMAAREGLDFYPEPASDSAPLVDAVASLQRSAVPLRALRDATRGGLGAVLHEWAEASGHTLVIEEARLPVTTEVRGACELLGLDPIHVANEGTMVVAVPRGESGRALVSLRDVAETPQAAYIGRVESRGVAAVVVERATGQRVPLDEPIGAPLPRIC